MKIGRNDPCPCGSGKKYKHCCLRKDQGARRAEMEAERAQRKAQELMPEPPPRPESPPTGPEPPDPHLETFNARWEEFEALEDYESQVALFVKTLEDEKGLMDDDMAFEMLNVIFYASAERNERDRFDALVDALRERLPEVYAHDAHYYLEWRAANALATGRLAAIPALANEMATTAGRNIDAFNNFLNMLAYHGRLSALVEAMRIAWPLVESSDNIIPWGIDEFARRAADYAVFEYLERHSVPAADDLELMKQLEFYLEIDPTRLARYMAYLTGQAERRWTMDDFDLRRDGSKDADEESGRQDLFYLSVEFLGYLRREEGVPYTRGELGREQIVEYILDRYDGELEPRESMLEAVMRPKKRKPRPRRRQPAHLLCPDRGTLDRYLAGLLGFFNPQHYRIAAAFELVPAWLRFLESRQLVDSELRKKTLLELRGLDTGLLKIWENYTADPALQEGIRGWRENAEIEDGEGRTEQEGV